MDIIVDTNILISALIKDGATRELIVNSNYNLVLPELELKEIENHKYEILGKSGLLEEEFYNLLSNLLKYIKIIRTEKVVDYRKKAFEIIGHIDIDDVIFIATALCFNCPIWSDDMHFKKQNKIKILTTSDMVDNLK